MPNRPIDIRGYDSRQDLAPLLDFAGRCLAARFPLSTNWHPGDFIWELKPDYDRRHGVRMWMSDAGIEAVTMFMGVDTLWFDVLPESEDLVPDIVARAERARLRTADGAEQPKLSIRAFEGDARRIEALEALGYVRGEPDHVWFRRDLSLSLPHIAPLPGFRTRDCIGVDPELRAAVHRDAWNDLSEIGIPNARSSFSADVYRAVRDAPGYDPSLDILIEDESGAFVANCICWADATSRIGIFEPTGTNPAFRRRGLTRFAMLEGLRRLQQRGMKWAGVGTAHFNHPAIATYGSIFTPFDRTRWWTKVLHA